MTRLAVITGCSGGIGNAMVARFLAGSYRVVGLDRRKPDGAAPSTFVETDLQRFARDEQYRTGIVDRVTEVATGGMVHALVNNAAEQILAATADIAPAQWQATMDVNVTAPFLLVQALLPQLANARGSIINIASIHALLTKPGFAAYATSKAALVGLTRALAVDLGDRIRVNAICPAAIATPMLIEGLKSRPKALEQLNSYHPTQAIGRPEETADLAFAMCADTLPFLNGSVVNLDGGIGSRLHDPV
ncbi:SDR family oxidoreductase [Ramlibacter sp. XY19]|uniref:SDR family NAD(P)-dependent oxidoreductase n=1 Tax=Ramlibacter paludis TaxID=2908000 RepID=UPI0023DBEAA4|nr:SDR family oxidoreductase [Ramlibacter paludis]MCG2592021.1 SDR family oxidoreductase [Ramlibacter paludis]